MLVYIFFPLPKRLFAVIASFSYIYISQGSAQTHSRCGGIYNTHAIANCLHSVPVKEF